MSEAVSPQADKHSDRPYDEAVDVSGDEASTPGSSPNPTSGEAGPADALGGAAASPAAEFGEGEHQAGTDDSPVGGDGTTPQIGGGATGSGASGGRSQASSSPGKSSPSQSPSPVAAKKMGGKLEGLGDSGKKSSPKGKLSPAGKGSGAKNNDDDDDEESSEDDSTSSEDDDGEDSMIAGQYNPADYANLKVSPEITELFQYITRYKPHSIELDTKLKAFIPDFIPAIGEVDACLKIPRPDGKPDGLGLAQLDEPTLNPSDPTVLDLQLRAMTKKKLDDNTIVVKSISGENTAEIRQWVTRIQDLHRTKPPTLVQYSKKLPDVENLMQVWPAEFEEFIDQRSQASGAGGGGGGGGVAEGLSELSDLTLKEYIKVVCVLLDIPVYNDSCLTDSLHLLFSLYSEFKNNQHFNNFGNAGMGVPGMGMPGMGGANMGMQSSMGMGSPGMGGGGMQGPRVPTPV